MREERRKKRERVRVEFFPLSTWKKKISLRQREKKNQLPTFFFFCSSSFVTMPPKKQRSNGAAAAAAAATTTATTSIAAPWTLSASEASKALGVDPSKGLSTAEVELRRAAVGANELAREPATPLWKLVLAQFDDMLVKVSAEEAQR